MQKNFVETGFGSQILALSDDGGVPLAETQGDLTPLQRNVLLLQMEKKQEKIDEKKQQARSGASGGARNPLHGSGGGQSGQTTTYVNESLKE